eukprot:8314627-Karenia_brevis.AAC.1
MVMCMPPTLHLQVRVAMFTDQHKDLLHSLYAFARRYLEYVAQNASQFATQHDALKKEVER